MRIARRILPVAILCVVLGTVTAYADDEIRPGELDGRAADARLTLNETITVMVDVEVELDGRTYVLALPATLRVDSQRELGEARLIAANDTRVGMLSWHIRSVDEYRGDYALTRYTTLSPSSSANKLVVVSTDVTNLGRDPLNAIQDIRGEFAYDALGNRYESMRRQCDSINPGATGTCVLVFEIPHLVTLNGLELAVVERRRLAFPAGNE